MTAVRNRRNGCQVPVAGCRLDYSDECHRVAARLGSSIRRQVMRNLIGESDAGVARERSRVTSEGGSAVGPVGRGSLRLGHSKVAMTMEVYVHVLPDMQERAATQIGALLHG